MFARVQVSRWAFSCLCMAWVWQMSIASHQAVQPQHVRWEFLSASLQHSSSGLLQRIFLRLAITFSCATTYIYYESLCLEIGIKCARVYKYLLYGVQSSCEANRFSASQEIPIILRNTNVHYRIHKCPPPVPILSQINPVHVHTHHFLKIHLNVILPSQPVFPTWSLSYTYTSALPHTCYMPRQPHYSRFDHPNNIGVGVQIIKLLTV
jgi:hypothetical protein